MKVKEKMKLYGSVFLLLLFIPYLITVYMQGDMLPFWKQYQQQSDMEQQIAGIVAAQIPAEDHLETLKAQAVIVRTNLWRARQKHETEDNGWSEEKMRAVWGKYYESYRKKMDTAVSGTQGQILKSGESEEPVMAAYHFASCQKTRNASEVPGQEAFVWLASVESSQDLRADGYLKIQYMEKEKMAEILQTFFDENHTVDAKRLPGALDISQRDSAGYVTRISYDGVMINAEAFRKAMGWNSACFYLSELEGKIRIVTKGIGHGLGLSQYGAERMAENGSSYREILNYYYKNIKITTIS